MPAPSFSAASPAPQPRGRWAGYVLGVAPQALLLAVFAMFLRASAADDRQYLALMVLVNLAVVPIAALIGGLCVGHERGRPFGRALLIGTGVAATAATVVILVASAHLAGGSAA